MQKRNKWLVKDWREGWKWASGWAFALIVFLTTVPLPPEVVELLPEIVQEKMIGVIAVLGLIMRFVKQPKISNTE